MADALFHEIDIDTSAPPRPLFRDVGPNETGLAMLLGRLDGKLDLVLVRGEAVEKSVKEVDTRLRDVEKCVVPRSEVEDRFNEVDARFTKAEARLNEAEQDRARMKGMWIPVGGFCTFVVGLAAAWVEKHFGG